MKLKIRKNKIYMLIAILTLIIFFSISTSFTKCEVQKKGGIFRSFIYEPSSLDPAYCGSIESIVIKQVWDGLVSYNPKTLKVKPSIAKSWDISDDGKVYTFHLKKGVEYHSERELTAEDFTYSWSRVALKDSGSDYAYLLEPIVGFDDCQKGESDILDGVKALDDYTLEVTLKYPFTDFIYLIGHPCFYPVAKEDIERWGENYSEHINGTGPFEFVKWEHGKYIELRRNEDYWSDRAYLDAVKFIILSDEYTAFLEFKKKNLEHSIIPFAYIKAIQSHPQYKDLVIIKPWLFIYYYGMNTRLEPFKGNLALRKAINYMIDREFICDIVGEGASTAATGIIPPVLEGFQENAMEFSYDPQKAKEKLIKAGYPDGEGLPTLILSIGGGSFSEMMALKVIQEDAKEIGINIEFELYEWETFLEKIENGEINFFRMGWIADYPTMDNFLFPLFYSKSSNNHFGYSNLEVDEMLIDARQTVDRKERITKYREIEKKVLKDAIIVPIYFYGLREIIQPYVRGFNLTSMGDFDLSSVWLDDRSVKEDNDKELEVKILDVILSNKIDKNMEPVEPVKSFSTGDDIYACIKLNYQKEGATLNAKWYFKEDELIYEDQYNITENYYQPTCIAFTLAKEEPLFPGKYKVEIYLNKYLYENYYFEIVREGDVTVPIAINGSLSPIAYIKI